MADQRFDARKKGTRQNVQNKCLRFFNIIRRMNLNRIHNFMVAFSFYARELRMIHRHANANLMPSHLDF